MLDILKRYFCMEKSEAYVWESYFVITNPIIAKKSGEMFVAISGK